jgi:spermidine/putrescine-binding protein
MKPIACRRLLTTAILALAAHASHAAGVLNVLNWSDYIAPDAVAKFEKETGIKVRYDILDSDDTLQAKLLSGRSGYDVVFPSSTFMVRQIEAGIYEEIDWSKVPNKSNLDPDMMKRLQARDPGNRYGVPYVWGTDGMTVNLTKARQQLGADAKFDSWDLIFKPEVASKLSKCGISMVDSPTDVFAVLLAHMGRNPNSKDPKDYEDAFQELRKIRPYITQFSSAYLSEMVSGDICIALGWSGDAGMIKRRAKEAGKKDEFAYIAPTGKTGVWFSLMGVPKDSANKENAYKWINFVISNEIAAATTNTTTYANAVPSSKPLIRPEVVNDTASYPSKEQLAGYFVFEPVDQNISRQMNKLWLRFKSGR